MNRRSRRAHGSLGRILASLEGGPTTLFALAERTGLEVALVEDLLHTLRAFGLAAVSPGADGIRRWRRAQADEQRAPPGHGQATCTAGLRSLLGGAP